MTKKKKAVNKSRRKSARKSAPRRKTARNVVSRKSLAAVDAIFPRSNVGRNNEGRSNG